jgi:hypothetical protein
LVRIKTVEEIVGEKPVEVKDSSTCEVSEIPEGYSTSTGLNESGVQKEKPVEVEKKTSQVKKPSQYFSNLFNSYAKSLNRKYNRTGSLFQERYKRKLVDSDKYFLNLIHYIHFNPQKHGFVKNFRDWKFSSYNAMLSEKPTDLKRKDVLDWFSGKDEFIEYHKLIIEYQKVIGHLIEGD